MLNAKTEPHIQVLFSGVKTVGCLGTCLAATWSLKEMLTNTRLFHHYAEYSSSGKADLLLSGTEHTPLNTQ